MAAYTSQKGGVDDPVGWRPVAVAGDHDDGEEHKGERIYSKLASDLG